MPTEATARQAASGSLRMGTGTAGNLTSNLDRGTLTVSAEQSGEREKSDSFQANYALK